MNDVEIRTRPFAVHALGLMMPDGIFDAALGVQTLSAHLSNAAAGALDPASSVYLEAISDPGITVAPATHAMGNLPPGATTLRSWQVDMTNASPGSHRVSFVAVSPAGSSRIIKKIYVTRTLYDPSSGTFAIEFPQGRLDVEFLSMLGPKTKPCCDQTRPDHLVNDNLDRPQRPMVRAADHETTFLDLARDLATNRRASFVFCHDEYLVNELRMTFTPNPSYAGQYSDLPFDDPWWKVVLCVLAVIALIAAAIVGGTQGGANVSVGTGNTPTGSPVNDCCGVRASGGGSNYVAALLVAAAAALATIASMTDERDIVRRGQDNTDPGGAAITVSEAVSYKFHPRDPIVPGRPFRVGTSWSYERVLSNGNVLQHDVQDEVQRNTHLLDHYEVEADDVILAYRKEEWVVRARFFDQDEKQMTGPQLFVQCILFGPDGRSLQLAMRDDGIEPDVEADDGWFTAHHWFDMPGMWRYIVVAQDVNGADEGLDPEDAAKIIGGMVLTSQVSISFTGGDCPLVPDGHVQVL